MSGVCFWGTTWGLYVILVESVVGIFIPFCSGWAIGEGALLVVGVSIVGVWEMEATFCKNDCSCFSSELDAWSFGRSWVVYWVRTSCCLLVVAGVGCDPASSA